MPSISTPSSAFTDTPFSNPRRNDTPNTYSSDRDIALDAADVALLVGVMVEAVNMEGGMLVHEGSLLLVIAKSRRLMRS